MSGDSKRWNAKRRKQRREFAFAQLGGKCARCASTTNLELDHIDKSTKLINVSKLWTNREEDFLAELQKCQILCSSCHKIKTNEENNEPLGHGTNATYTIRKCRCNLCKEAHNQYMRNYRGWGKW